MKISKISKVYQQVLEKDKMYPQAEHNQADILLLILAGIRSNAPEKSAYV